MNPNANGNTLVGKSIISRAGEEIGRVREVKGGYFRVESSPNGGYWLSTAYIIHAPPDAVLISLHGDAIHQHRLAAPGLEPSLVPDSGRATDLLISDHEALAQREQMERELAMQRLRRYR